MNQHWAWLLAAVAGAVAGVLSAALAPAWAVANLAPPLGYVCYRAASPPRIDGRLDDLAWQGAAWTEEFVDIEGAVRPRPSLPTRANALGTGWDLLLTRPYKDGGKAVNGWDIAGLKTAVHLDGTLNDAADTDRGWTVEMAFPWPALGEVARTAVPPAAGDQWRVNFSRVDWKLEVADGRYRKVPGVPEHNWVWSPQGAINMHRPESWGYLQFSTSRSGTVAFRPDASWPARRLLHEVYYGQQQYRRTHGRWARTLGELGVAAPSHGTLAQPAMEVTADLFQASVELRLADKKPQRWNIRQDSLVWPD